MVAPAQCDVWWAQSPGGRRPVLVITRNEAIPVLNKLVVAPITRTVRGIATEVALDADDGLAQPCAASFDNLRVVLKSHLVERVSALPHRRTDICTALAAMADC
ncbi:type II toxin-antitoxin system PemK/MazF family toxin [Candidatus Poriferisodalis sp.]|uniref:type II toxin-antitoxin system PemK/MazF family toxin n=1 Tax=Candidatus Poriferisodalis sp. TaxID=3101277 RepID=UPI003B529437